MSNEERDKEIITRANFFYQTVSIPFDLGKKVKEASQQNRLDFEKPLKPLRMQNVEVE